MPYIYIYIHMIMEGPAPDRAPHVAGPGAVLARAAELLAYVYK